MFCIFFSSLVVSCLHFMTILYTFVWLHTISIPRAPQFYIFFSLHFFSTLRASIYNEHILCCFHRTSTIKRNVVMTENCICNFVATMPMFCICNEKTKKNITTFTVTIMCLLLYALCVFPSVTRNTTTVRLVWMSLMAWHCEYIQHILVGYFQFVFSTRVQRISRVEKFHAQFSH